MSELTNKRLNEIVSGQNTVSIPEAVELARELLTLRTLRDAGDEEVLHQRAVVCNGIWSKDKRDHEEADKAIDSIVSTVASLRQQLREARAEIERLSGKLEDTQETCINFSQQIATLTAERDEALDGVKTLTETVNSLNGQNDRLRQELAALKSCPAMAEVDAILQDTEKSSEQIESDLADIARRAIAAQQGKV